MKRSKQFIYHILGLLFFGIGILGIAVPLLPTVPLWIVAAFLFATSSPTLQKKIYSHPKFGDMVEQFVEQGVLTRRSKYFSIAGASLGSVISMLLIKPPQLIAWPVLFIMTAVVFWLATRPEQVADVNDDQAC